MIQAVRLGSQFWLERPPHPRLVFLAEPFEPEGSRRSPRVSQMVQTLFKPGGYTGCSNSICTKTNAYWAIKNTLLSHKHKICTLMRCGILTYDSWIWLKITSLSSTASDLNDGRISLEIPSFCAKIFCFKTLK